MIAQPAGMDACRHEGVAERVHLDDGSHLGGIAVIEGVSALGQRGGGGRFDRHQAGALPVLQILAQERVGDPGKVRAAAHAADDHIRVFPGQVHLLQGFLADDGLVHQHVVQHRAEAVFLGPRPKWRPLPPLPRWRCPASRCCRDPGPAGSARNRCGRWGWRKTCAP